ncbi:kinesin-related protein 4-like [Astatotilapia calliptera]|uniref:kinesin-related protein 4-like n=1 Tax=Astatotilapia calliptera TaxID=8154 RepID=UPI000E41889A|nr:kinesin-related protein 4-like [Astatotilapia calliptera]
MSSKANKDRNVNFSKTMVKKSEKEKETYARQFEQRLQPMIDEVEKLKTELDYFKNLHTVNKKRIEDLTKENNELLQNNKLLGSVLDDRTNIADRLDSIKDDHEALVKFRAETEKTLAELKEKHEDEVQVLQGLLETEKEKVARQQFHNSQVVELLLKRHKEEKNQMQQFYQENTKKLENKANAADRKLEEVINMYDSKIEKLQTAVKNSRGVTVNAVKEREEERQSSQCWIDGVLWHNTKLQDENEFMVKNMKELTEEKGQMGKVIDDQKAQNMAIKQKCQSNIRALALEKKMKAMLEDEVDSLKKKIEDVKKALSTEQENHRKTAVDRHKVKAAHNQALAEKVALEEKLRSTKKQRERFISKVNWLEKKERYFQEELCQCVLSFEKAFPHEGHLRGKEKVEFRDMFHYLKKKYVDGVEGTPFVGTTEFLEKQLNCLRIRCKDLDAALLAKTRELESFKKQYNDMVKSSEYALFRQREELIGPVNQIIQKAANEEKEIGHLKSRVKDAQLQLKLEKQKGQKLASLDHRSMMGRCSEETPSQINPRPLPGKTTFIQVRPRHPGRSAGMASPVNPPVESPSTPPFLNSDDGLPPVDC